VKESNYREPNNKFIINFDKDYQAALAFKGITLQKSRSNYSVRAYFSKNKYDTVIQVLLSLHQRRRVQEEKLHADPLEAGLRALLRRKQNKYYFI